MNINLITFSTNKLVYGTNYKKNQKKIDSTCKNANINNHFMYNEDFIKTTDFYHTHFDIFQNKKGFGFWIWKPYLILETMKKIQLNEYVYYQDCFNDIGFKHDVTNVVKFMDLHNITFLPGLQEEVTNKSFIKDELKKYFVLNDNFYNNKSVCASPLFIKNTLENQKIIQHWLDLCLVRNLIFKEPNPTKVQHNYDMSILNCILYHYNIYPLNINVKKEQTKDYNYYLSLFEKYNEHDLRKW